MLLSVLMGCFDIADLILVLQVVAVNKGHVSLTGSDEDALLLISIGAVVEPDRVLSDTPIRTDLRHFRCQYFGWLLSFLFLFRSLVASLKVFEFGMESSVFSEREESTVKDHDEHREGEIEEANEIKRYLLSVSVVEERAHDR